MIFYCDNWKIAFTAICIFVISLYIYIKWDSNIFKRRGVKHVPFDGPVVGNMLKVAIQKEHIVHLILRIYNSFPDQRFVGFKQMTNVFILLRDLDLIKQLTIKEFDHFADRVFVVDQEVDKFFGANLSALKGEKWKDMRATLSPAFTSSKIRNMFEFISEVAEQTVNFFLENVSRDDSKDDFIEVELKDTYTRFANDVIASTAFGLKINSLVDRDNDFYTNGLDSTNFSGLRILKILFMTSFPKLNKLLKFQMIPKHLKNFYCDLVLSNMAERKQKGILRNDMIQLLMEAKNGTLKYQDCDIEEKDIGYATTKESHEFRKWTDDELISQVFLFFFAGFETVTNLLCFMTHELAMNPEVQKKLQNEIDDFNNDFKVFNYDNLYKMTYMDMVVSEVLRKWPPLVSIERKCTKEYTLSPPSDESEQSCVINKGEGIWIPIYSIHNDPEHFPDPEKFDPERFSDENRKKIKPYSYLPFGIGPRNCIGSKLALMEAKVAIFHLLKMFDVVPTSNTQHPIKLSPKSFNLTTENGFWVGLKLRTNQKSLFE